MTRARATIGAVAVTTALVGTLYLAVRLKAPTLPARSIESTTTVSAPSLPPNAGRGRQLAQIYCQSCHLFPEPNLLDKATWERGALPDMMPWLGLARPNLERRRDGTVISEANVFPSSPILPLDDWEAIRQYYLAAAPAKPLPQGPRPPIHTNLTQFKIKTLAYQREVPMTTLVKIDSNRLYVGDAMTHTLEALTPAGEREFAVDFDSAPISLRIQGGLLDLTLVGRLFPSDDTKGKLLKLRPSSDDMAIGKVLDHLRRPTDTTFADLNGDGLEDFIICQFGNRVGRLSWFENLGNGKFDEHILADQPGAIRSQVYDANGDGLPDIFVLMGQAREGVYLFLNRGHGKFAQTALIEQPPAFGYAYFELVDFNQDGHIDLLTVNGDNGEFPSPPRNYHGVRIYLNDGRNQFSEKWFFPLNGAYKAVARDFDGDGDLDIAAISFFPDYEKSPGDSFVYLENRGDWKFEAYSFPQCNAGRWITMDAGDLDGDGDIDIVLGSLILGPSTTPIPESVQAGWKTNHLPLLLLENVQARGGRQKAEGRR